LLEFDRLVVCLELLLDTPDELFAHGAPLLFDGLSAVADEVRVVVGTEVPSTSDRFHSCHHEAMLFFLFLLYVNALNYKFE
jgi:hypothetical protein